FWGRPRWDEGVEPHESPKVMTIPLIVLAVLSVVAGFVNTPFRFALEHFLEPAFEGVQMAHPPEGWSMFLILAGLSTLAGIAGVAAAWLTYNRPPEAWQRFQEGFGRLWTAWENAYWVDDVYGATIVGPGRRLAEFAAFQVDARGVDGAVNGLGAAVARIGSVLRGLQAGFVRNYAAGFAAGVLVVAVWLIARGLRGLACTSLYSALTTPSGARHCHADLAGAPSRSGGSGRPLGAQAAERGRPPARHGPVRAAAGTRRLPVRGL